MLEQEGEVQRLRQQQGWMMQQMMIAEKMGRQIRNRYFAIY